jgi:hypothetical protein
VLAGVATDATPRTRAIVAAAEVTAGLDGGALMSASTPACGSLPVALWINAFACADCEEGS